jgi:hypothetical protein
LQSPLTKFDERESVSLKYRVQDKSASLNEYNVALALNRLEIGYIFQYALLGGRTLIGGYVIDFLAFTTPLSTPIWVNEKYWHSGMRAERDFWQQVITDYVTAGEMAQAVIMTGFETETEEAALAALRKYIV